MKNVFFCTLLGGVLVMLSACASVDPKPTLAQVDLYTAGKGSAFLPYGQGLATYLSARGLRVTAVETAGSVENIKKLNDEPHKIATVFLGTAAEATSGLAAWTNGKKYENLRALFPMYETSFQLVALKSSGISSVGDLSGKRVGVGPAGGPAENFFKGLLAELGLAATIINGTPAALSADLISGKIDALWQGAVPPIPSIKQVADQAESVVFGLRESEQKAMLKRFPFLFPATVATGTYAGQRDAIATVAAWNFVLGHRDMPESDAYWITRTVLSSSDPKQIHASAESTRVENAITNSVIPFHPGALRFYKEKGIVGLR